MSNGTMNASLMHSFLQNPEVKLNFWGFEKTKTLPDSRIFNLCSQLMFAVLLDP